jgi:hypothetical protein
LFSWKRPFWFFWSLLNKFARQACCLVDLAVASTSYADRLRRLLYRFVWWIAARCFEVWVAADGRRGPHIHVR